MGCDIHTYLEFADFEQADGRPYWSNFTRNGGSRNYVMFGVLAGVRVPEVKLFEPKGMPADGLGYYTSDDYWTYVAPAEHPEWADSDSHCSIEQAERWVESGSSIAEHDEQGRLRRVSDPDWHSHSWLTADELEQALAHYSKVVRSFWATGTEIHAEWQAMLSAMRTFEAAGKQTRLIFWFDN